MKIVDLESTEGRRYPARRWTRNIVGGASTISTPHFCMGMVVLEPQGGQVPWHNHPEEEVYVLLTGRAEMCLGDERTELSAGQAVHIPSNVFHQLTNLGETPASMIYAYGPAGDVAHWRQELEGTLPRAGVEAPPLPDGAHPQHTATEAAR